MNNDLIIRPYIPGDKNAVMQLFLLNVPAYFDASETAHLDTYLDHKTEQYFVAVLHDRIIGSGGINFEHQYNTGKISWDIIHPDFQGIGVGTRLLQHRISLCLEMSTINTLSVRTSQLVYRFYEKQGFQLEEIHMDYWAPGFDMYKMSYPIPQHTKDLSVGTP